MLEMIAFCVPKTEPRFENLVIVVLTEMVLSCLMFLLLKLIQLVEYLISWIFLRSSKKCLQFCFCICANVLYL
jgi:hypothetical protein